MVSSWTQAYLTGIEQVDAEHSRLIAMLDRLEASAGQGDQSAVVTAIIEEMRAYALEHFRNEEYLMRKSGYPRLDFHRKLHQGFARKAEDLKLFARIDAAELHSFLLDWLREHILKTDRDYIPWVKAWLKSQE